MTMMSRTQRRAQVLSALFLVCTLVACGYGDGRSADYGLRSTPQLSDLEGKTWVAHEIVDPDRQLVSGSSLTMTFGPHSLSANAGCNTLHGAASVQDDELVASQLASTMMACEEALMAQDTWLSDFLTSKPTIEHFDDNVWLSQGDTVIHLVAEEED
jgi:heat shock protein HslJ